MKFVMVKTLASMVLVKSGFGPNFVTAATWASWSFVNLVIFQQVSMGSMLLSPNIILAKHNTGRISCGIENICWIQNMNPSNVFWISDKAKLTSEWDFAINSPLKRWCDLVFWRNQLDSAKPKSRERCGCPVASISNLVFSVRDRRSPLITVIAIPMINPAAPWWLLSIKADGSNYRFILGTEVMTVTIRCYIICK